VPDEEERLRETQALASADPEEARDAARRVVLRVAPALPAESQRRLMDFIAQVPTMARRSLLFQVPTSPGLACPWDLRVFIPPRPPRFKAGDRPLSGTDLELVQLLGMGSFGEVWKACNHRLPDMPAVALKFCLDPQAQAWLLTHEGKVLQQLMRYGRHPG